MQKAQIDPGILLWSDTKLIEVCGSHPSKTTKDGAAAVWVYCSLRAPCIFVLKNYE